MTDIITCFARAWGTAGAAFLSGKRSFFLCMIQVNIITRDAEQLFSGFIACFSHAGVPTLNIAPVDVLVHEFRIMYNIGKATSPLLAITATVCNAFLA